MTLQEMAVLVDEGLPVKIAIFNNGYLGMVRQWQQLFYDKNLVSVAMTQPDFVKLADAYGIRGIRVETKAEVASAIREARAHKGPILLDFQIDQEENVWPMVPGRRRPLRDDRGPGRGARPMNPTVNGVVKNRGEQRTVVAIVEDKPGVLMRVSSLFRRRGFNIESLTVGHSEAEGLSRITIVVDGESAPIEQVEKQLYKLIDVVKVSDLSHEDMVARELALIKVRCNNVNRHELLDIANVFRADVIDIATNSIILQVVGDEDKSRWPGEDVRALRHPRTLAHRPHRDGPGHEDHHRPRPRTGTHSPVPRQPGSPRRGRPPLQQRLSSNPTTPRRLPAGSLRSFCHESARGYAFFTGYWISVTAAFMSGLAERM